MAFPCTRCGACCSSVGHVTPLVEEGWVGDDGVCKQYDRVRRVCRIYDVRPMICRIDEGRPAFATPEIWTEMNIHACDLLHLRMYGQPRELSGDCTHEE